MGVSKWTGEGKADPDFALSSRVWGGEGRTGGGEMGFADDAGTGEEGKCHRSARAQNFERGGVLKVLYPPFSRTMEGKTLQPKKTYIKRYRGKDVGAPKITERL